MNKTKFNILVTGSLLISVNCGTLCATAETSPAASQAFLYPNTETQQVSEKSEDNNSQPTVQATLPQNMNDNNPAENMAPNPVSNSNDVSGTQNSVMGDMNSVSNNDLSPNNTGTPNNNQNSDGANSQPNSAPQLPSSNNN